MSDEVMTYLSPKTLIPLSLVFSILGGVFWLSVMWSNGNRNTEDIQDIKGQVRELQIGQSSLDRNFVRLEQILERIDKRTEIFDQYTFNPQNYVSR